MNITIDSTDELKRDRKTLGIFISRGTFEKIGQAKYRTRCIFHADSTASCDVFLHARDKVWIFHCLGCGVSGNVFSWLMKIDGITFPAAVKVVQDYLGGSPERRTFVPTIAPEEPKRYITTSITDYHHFEDLLAKSKAARNWLWTERGIDYTNGSEDVDSIVKILHLGYRQSIQSRVPELQDVLDRGWIVFPSFEGERVTLLKYRSIARKAFAREFGMETCLFNANSINEINSWYVNQDVYVTEGEFDAAVLVQANFRAVSIGSTTTPITPKMLDQLKRARRIVLAGDSDGVGVKKMQDLQAQIPGSLLLRWPDCRDANSFWLQGNKYDAEGFRHRVQRLTKVAEKGTV